MRDVDVAPEFMMTKDAYGNLMTVMPCPLHVTYTGQRAPRIDCDGCWRVYKTKHPSAGER